MTASSVLSSLIHSDNDGDDNDDANSSLKIIGVDDKQAEPYMPQLGTPTKLSDDADESFNECLKRSESKGYTDSSEMLGDNSFLEDHQENNDDGSGGSSAASTAADIMRDMLNDLPRSNDTLGIEVNFILNVQLIRL